MIVVERLILLQETKEILISEIVKTRNFFSWISSYWELYFYDKLLQWPYEISIWDELNESLGHFLKVNGRDEAETQQTEL